MKLRELSSVLDGLAPPGLAEDWDNVGLQLGDPEAIVSGVLFTLDVSEAHLDEAASRGANVIVSHHPPIFRPLRAITADRPVGRILLQAAEEKIALYAAHTNLDAAVGGVNDALAELLGVENTCPLKPSKPEASYKLVVFVPREDVGKVRDAMCRAGAGRIGNYTYCSFRSPGTGSFLPEEEAQPAVGEKGALNEVEEDRLEVLVEGKLLHQVSAAMHSAHPYEEVAYDLYRLENPSPAGIGRLGELSSEETLGALLKRWLPLLGAKEAQVVGSLDRPIRRVALCGGSAGDLVSAAFSVGADMLLSGELRHHAGQEAAACGLCLVEVGHDVSERVVLSPWRERLGRELTRRGTGLPLHLSELPTAPWERFNLE